MVDGTLYVTTPDNAWALDARDGRELWHYFWKTRGGTHIANRGLGMWNDYLYMETPDNYLVSLEAQDRQGALAQGNRRLRRAVLLDDGADRRRQPRDRRHRQRPRLAGLPAVVRPRDRRTAVEVLHGADEPGRSRPRDVGEPRRGAARRRAAVAARRLRSGDASSTSSAPAIRRRPTRRAAAKATTCSPCSLVAVNVDTGKMAWYFQTSPHDMHDWDSAQTPILFDAVDRRQAAQARVDRGAQRLLLHARSRHRRAPRDEQVRHRRRTGARACGRTASVRRNHEKDPVGRRLARVADRRRHDQLGAAGLLAGHRAVLRLGAERLFAVLSDRLDPRGSMGLGGVERVSVGSAGSFLTAIDPKTGKIAWRQQYPARASGGGGGLLDDGRRAPVRRRRRRQHRRVRRDDRQAALALAHRQRHEPADHLHARRPPVPAGGEPITCSTRLLLYDPPLTGQVMRGPALRALALAVHDPAAPPRNRPAHRRAARAAMAAADGSVAIRSASLPCAAAWTGHRPDADVLDLRGLHTRRGHVRAAVSRPRPVCRLVQLSLLRRDGAALCHLDDAAPGSALVRRHHSDHLSLHRRGVSLHVRDLSRS